MRDPAEGRSPGRASWRRLRHSGGSRRALIFLCLVGLLAFLVPLLPVAAPNDQDLEHKLEPPSLSPLMRGGFDPAALPDQGPVARTLLDLRVRVFGDAELAPVFGTDTLGRCVLSRTLWGARVTLLVALVASLVSLVIGVATGTLAGYIGGRTDTALMRLVDILQSLPLMFMVIFVVAVIHGLRQERPELGVEPIVVLFAVIGAMSWLVMARIVRGQVLALKEAPFIEAARAAGCTTSDVIRHHVIPNISPVVIVTLTLMVPRVILLEAFLSFLGLGVQPPDVSWGLLARESFDAITAVHVSWWVVLFPGLVMALTLYAMNTLGDGLRDALDPRLQRLAEESP